MVGVVTSGIVFVVYLVVYRYLLGFGLLVCFLPLWVLVVMFDYCWLAFV